MNPIKTVRTLYSFVNEYERQFCRKMRLLGTTFPLCFYARSGLLQLGVVIVSRIISLVKMH